MSSEAPVTTMWQRHSIRGDIQGLRAVAVLLVLIYHVWPSALPGGYIGVDVFFVISGYLIVGSLVKELEREGKVSLLNFYRRRAKRLMPAALAVLGAVLVATILWLPQARWEDTLFQVVSSALYVQNWYLSWSSVDYLAAENAPSPVLHYWSLSIEEQFYILWPIVMVVVGWILTRLKLPVRTVVGWVLVTVFSASFISSIVITAESPPQAYFFSHTRFWEIALGGLIATWLPDLKLSHSVRATLFAVGLALVLVAGFTYGGVAFPGWLALLPVAGTGLILIAGAFSVGHFKGLDAPPLRYVGDISYSLYLWHWPIIVFYIAWKGDVTVASGLGIILITFFVSHLSYRYIEERFRHRSVTLSMGPLASGFAGAAVVAGCSLLLYAGVVSTARPEAASRDAVTNDYPGPAALVDGAKVPADVPLLPAPAHLLRDRSVVYDSGCHQNLRSAEVSTCVLGREDGKFTVAVVGSSHSVNWLPAIDLLGRRNDWRVVSITKSACGFQNNDPQACRSWHENVAAYLRENTPDLVVVGESVGQSDNSKAQEQIASRLEKIIQLGVPVIAISPTPRLEKAPADCLPHRVGECEVSWDIAMRVNAFALAQQKLDNLYVVDMTDAICRPPTCGAVVGNLVVFRDRHHLTATYSRALAPYLQARIAELLPNLVPINEMPWNNTVTHLDQPDNAGAILRCGGFDNKSSPFARSYRLQYSDGQIRLRRGDVETKENGFETWDGEVKGEVVRISGSYREGSGGVKSVELIGTVIDGVLLAGGSRGPRSCSVYWSPPGDLFTEARK
ncbi:acyltransferase family protein [Luteimonas sp. MJ293]|uniref:acyltransferase family protein n=1 Tax=Luteimonas sp. MJ146 TaxID=3129240 RepID=UPI0031BA2511